MKVTRSQLKEIIKEELQTVISEGGAMGHSPGRGQLEVMREAGLEANEINFVTQILDNQIDSTPE